MTDPLVDGAVTDVPTDERGRSLPRRIAGFAGLPLLSLLAPFLFLPVLARLAGEDAWVAIALGQSVGGFVALVAGFGYPTLAPPRVAVADEATRRRILATSLHVRLPLTLVGGAVGAVVAVLLSPEGVHAEAALMAVAMSLAGLAPTWFWIGAGKVRPILWLEVVPRLIASLAATGILLAGGQVIWYPVLLLLSMLIAPVVVSGRVAGAEALRVRRDEVHAVWREHPPGVVAETAAGVYTSLAVTLVTAVTPLAQAARYVSGDKAYRIGQYAVSALGNALQGWTVEAGRERLGARLRRAISLHLALGVAGLAGFGLLGPLVTRVAFGESVAIDSATAWGFGVAMLGVSLGTACGRIGLISIGARTAFMTSVLAASALGAAGLLVGASLWGAAGAAWGMGVAELASGLAQGLVLRVLWLRRMRDESDI